jgi:Zn finger protein HypA/HybF involved in hydrogenase expression
MHEFSFVSRVIDEVRTICKKEPVAITLEVGELANLTCEEIEKAMKLMVKWDVNFIKKKGVIECLKCGFRGRPKILERYHVGVLLECPKCKGKKLKIIQGEKIILKKVLCRQGKK